MAYRPTLTPACVILILGHITMTENYGLPGFVLHSQFILNELACYTCLPTTRGPVHCNTNSVTQFPSVNNGRYRGSLSVSLRFGRDIVLFTHIHLLFYCVVFLNNQRRHSEVISLLTTTILSLSLNSLGCYQTDIDHFVCDAWRVAHALFLHSPPGVASVLLFVLAAATFGQYKRLANVLSTNYFRHTDENPLL